jgi:uncharacterized alkaline shock family protein YloU
VLEGGNLTGANGKLGVVDVSPEAIAMVAGIAALECFGVVGMASRSFQDGIAELFRGRDNLGKGIEVQIEDDQVILALYVIVEYGIRINEVAKNVIENVKYAVEKHLGLTVNKVNVIVQGVQMGVKG